MQCNQLIRLMKGWYLQVQEETMAPARMMQFVDKHMATCSACLKDSELSEEVEKIRDFVLPESKIPKSERADEYAATPEISPDTDNESEDNENGENTINDEEEI